MTDFNDAPFSATDSNDGACAHDAVCFFAQSVGRSPVLKVKYAALYRYCRGGDSSQCARLRAMRASGRPLDGLLPDGSLDPSIAGRQPRVLVVDDVPVFRKLMEGIVARSIEGVEIVSAGGGQEALTMLSSGDVDLVVTDYNMPGISGGDLVKELRGPSRRSGVPVIVFSTETDPAILAEVTAHERVRWVVKSPERQEFTRAIDELMIQGLG